MRSLLSVAILLIVTTLPAKAMMPNPSTAIEVQTFGESCAGEANGSFYASAARPNFRLDVYRNGSPLNTFAVAGIDTFIHGLSMGCYTFVYTSDDGSTETVSRIISAPSGIISLCRVHYLNRAGQNAVSFINLSSGAVAFDWDFGDGGEHSAEVSPEHAYTKPGTYTVTLTAYNLAGCASVSTYIVSIGGAEETGLHGESGQQQ